VLKRLVGSGDRIGMLLLPFLVIGLALNLAFPRLFDVGGPSETLRVISIAVLGLGIVIWIWSAVLILTNVPRQRLITTGPYAFVKHPLYTGVAVLVLPWFGFLLNTWLGLALGIVLYIGDRLFAAEEEAVLAERFGPRWDAYSRQVLLPWV